MSADYSAINIISISNIKRERVSAIEADWRDVRQVTLLGKLKRGSLALEKQVTLLEKLKRESLALEGSVQDDLDLVLVSNLPTDLGNY